MLASRVGRALRSAAPALAAASVLVAAGSFAAPAPAGEDPPCDPAAVGSPAALGEAPPVCVDPAAPPPPTVTVTPVEEPPTEPPTDPPTMTVGPETPWPTDAATAPSTPARTSLPAKPKPVSPAISSGGIFGSGLPFGSPPPNGTPSLSGGPYVFPVVGQTSFSDTWGAARATVAWHHGVDVFAPLGAPIVAVADGALFSVGWNTIGGRRLWLRDRQGNYFYYAHLSAFSAVAVDGARVQAGTVIGFVGNTGDAEGTPYHLHFEIHPVSLLSLGYDGAVDPFSYVSAWRRFGEATGPYAIGAGTAPAPAAVLIGFTDVSSADGLAPQSLDRTLEERPAFEETAVAAALVSTPDQPTTTASSRETIRAPRADDAQIAQSLDAEASRPARYGVGVWDELAMCESGGNWSTNTGNGFVGGLQFLPQTWASHGGDAFATSPHLATREQQIAVAERVLDSQGWRAWPACSAMLGLRSLTP